MTTTYSTNGLVIYFITKNDDGETIQSGMFTKDYTGPEKQDYENWLAEGNEAEQENK
jgi:hypothetical protein